MRFDRFQAPALALTAGQGQVGAGLVGDICRQYRGDGTTQVLPVVNPLKSPPYTIALSRNAGCKGRESEDARIKIH